MITYRITSAFIVNDRHTLIKAVFPSWDGQPEREEGTSVLVTFDFEQTPADLGPLVKVERVTDLSTLP